MAVYTVGTVESTANGLAIALVSLRVGIDNTFILKVEGWAALRSKDTIRGEDEGKDKDSTT